MDKLIKFFPFMPEKDSIGKLALAVVFYLAVNAVAVTVSVILSLTILLSPIGFILSYAAAAYYLMGIIFSILSFIGFKFSANNN